MSNIAISHNRHGTSLVTVTSDDKMKQMSVIGFVSVAALIHSHLYWVYSIIYIAYHKITPHKASRRTSTGKIRWRNGKFQSTVSLSESAKKKGSHSHHRHGRKRQLTHKPKAIVIPSAKPKPTTVLTSGTTAHADNAKDALLQQRVSLLHALRTFPSSGYGSKHTLNIHHLIKSQRRMPKRNNSTGHLNREAMPGLAHSEEDTSSCSSLDELVQTPPQPLSPSKRDRAMDLLRSTFHRSNSTGHMKQSFNSSFSLLDDDDTTAIMAAKKRNRNSIFGITRKFSGRASEKQNNNTAVSAKKPSRAKLFRSLSSWKKGK